MEEAIELSDYLPLSFKNSSEKEYIAFLWDAFEGNYLSGKYEFSSLAFHLLYMSFVSFSIWQIRFAREQDFKNALIGFQTKDENKLLEADTPFKFYENLKESQIFRFLKLIGCENTQVGEFSKFVKRRNKIAHPNGTVFFNNQRSIDSEISEMLREVANIQQHMVPIIIDIYRRFLSENSNIEEREYSEPEQEVEVNLIHKNYISQKDIETCLSFDINTLSAHENFESINELHNVLTSTYQTNNE